MTLNELENTKSASAANDNSYLINQIFALKDKQLSELSIEDLRLLIGQNLGLKHLVPLALEILSRNLFAEGDYYEGDLLKSLLTIDPDFWVVNNDLKEQLVVICRSQIASISNVDITDNIKEDIINRVERFCK